MSILKKIYYSCLLTVITANVDAQNVEVTMQPLTKLPLVSIDSSAKLVVRRIIINGNRKTKDYMILREIQFKPGDSIIIGTLNKVFQMARQQVYNTTLFHEVKVDLEMISAFEINVIVTVKERWSLFPVPQFQIVDRSFNEWLVKYKGDLSRVNYGIKFVDYNFSGRRDPLRLFLINGYTKNMSFSYSQPYSNRALTQGFGIGGGFSQNREIAYKTSPDNKILFFKNKDFVKKNIYLNLSLRLQKGILFRHLFNISYSRLTVGDSVISAAYNPNYFNTNNTTRGLIDFSYTYQYANVNNVAYPLKGVTSYLTLLKRGFGLTGGTNAFLIEGAYNKFWAHQNKWYTSLQFIGNIKLPFDQPYINQRAIGYGDANLRGLEYYVIDGVAFGIIKSTLKKKLFSFTIPMPFKTRILPTLPFTIFAKAYADAGFAYNKRKYDTYLNNRFLYTGGFGIDILTLYDIKLRIEYSFNQLGNGELFFESK
ncbi:MAG: POTRA domain-containing protein [Ferruginibacter sp.]